MAQSVPQPKHTVVPYLRVKGAAKAIEFYTKVMAAPNDAWSISTTKEQLTPDEMNRRGAEVMKQMGTQP